MRIKCGGKVTHTLLLGRCLSRGLQRAVRYNLPISAANYQHSKALILSYRDNKTLVWVKILKLNIQTKNGSLLDSPAGWSRDLVCSMRCSLALADWDKTVAKSCKSKNIFFVIVSVQLR